jgi:spermidine synthase
MVRVRAAADWVTPALAIIFIFSGASGLIYQISWVRLLSLTFGVTIYAVSTVVAAFMGGLALGSFLGGRVSDRVRHPILWYAVAEGIIAVMGLASPTALSWVQNAYVGLYPRESTEAAVVVVALRFALAAVVLLIPATLMGATLPLMVKGSLAMSQAIGPRVSWLYASNTSGAIIGTVAAGFVLIGTIGIIGTIATAAVLNLIAAGAALLLGAALTPWRRTSNEIRSPSDVETGAVAQNMTHQSVDLGPSPLVRRLVILTFAVQGFASLAYEVLWTRVLAIILDGSTYAFSIVLATVLLGIALGSALVSPLMEKPLPWVRVYALLQAGVAALAFLGVVVFARIYGIMNRLDDVTLIQQVLASHFAWMVVVAMVAILPPMILLGASFPIAARIVVSGTSNAGRDLGVLYAGNTTGAILGAWAAGFFLIPALGTQVSIELLAGLNAILAIALALTSGQGRIALAGAAGAIIVGSLAATLLLAPNMYARIVAGHFPGRDIVWVGEGQETSVAVLFNQANGLTDMFMNGQHQASDDAGTVSFHRLLGHIPMTLHPNPRDVLIVGLGGGSTAGALTRHAPDRVDVVELSDTVVEGARHFSHVNRDVHNAPSLHLKIDDGRNHLLLTNRKYDVITADVIHPRNAGAAVLYSYEYYELARKALKPGGVMSQWLEDRADSPDNEAQRKLMVRTFFKAFPYVTMWVWGALMIGSNEPIDIDLNRIEADWDKRGLSELLAGSGFDSPEAFRSLYAMSDEELRAWAGDGPIMTDNHPYVEYYLSLPGRPFSPRWSREPTRP